MCLLVGGGLNTRYMSVCLSCEMLSAILDGGLFVGGKG